MTSIRSVLPMISLSLLVVASACSSRGAYASKCDPVCQPPAGPCAGSDASGCQSTCTGATDGLTAACAQCMIEHSGWSGKTCNSQTGCVDSFGPGTTGSCSSGSTCTSADDACTGFVMGKISNSACVAFCAAAGDH